MTDKYITKDIHHVPAYIDGIYNPDCLLTEDQAQYMLQKNNYWI